MKQTIRQWLDDKVEKFVKSGYIASGKYLDPPPVIFPINLMAWAKTLPMIKDIHILPLQELRRQVSTFQSHHLIETENRLSFENISCEVEGLCLPLKARKYEIWIGVHEDSRNLVSNARAKFTLAHEIGHVILFEVLRNNNHTVPIKMITPADKEYFANQIASILLLPQKALTELIMEEVALSKSPQNLLLNVTQKANVNLQALLLRLNKTNILGDYSWFIGIFIHKNNPHKPYDVPRWRLEPGTLVLPIGLRGASSAEYWHVGFNTLGFVDEQTSLLKNMKELKSAINKLSEASPPWHDLNMPLTLRRRVPKYRLRIRPEYIDDDDLGVAKALLHDKSSGKFIGNGTDDQRWRLESTQPEILPLPHRVKRPAILITSNLILKPRKETAR